MQAEDTKIKNLTFKPTESKEAVKKVAINKDNYLYL